MEYIQLKKDSIYRIGIKTSEGNIKVDEKGNELYLEFDLEDIEAPLKYNRCNFLIKKAQQDLKRELLVIEKRPDKKGKSLLSANEEAKVDAVQKYYKTIEEAIDLFVGTGGTNKIFGDRRYWSMWDDLTEMLEPFLPKLKINLDEITEKVKNKYKNQDTDVLRDE